MKGITWLSDAEWARIEPLLPRGRRGARRVAHERSEHDHVQVPLQHFSFHSLIMPR